MLLLHIEGRIPHHLQPFHTLPESGEEKGGGRTGHSNQDTEESLLLTFLSNTRCREEKLFTFCSPGWKLLKGVDRDLLIPAGGVYKLGT